MRMCVLCSFNHSLASLLRRWANWLTKVDHG